MPSPCVPWQSQPPLFASKALATTPSGTQSADPCSLLDLSLLPDFLQNVLLLLSQVWVPLDFRLVESVDDWILSLRHEYLLYLESMSAELAVHRISLKPFFDRGRIPARPPYSRPFSNSTMACISQSHCLSYCLEPVNEQYPTGRSRTVPRPSMEFALVSCAQSCKTSLGMASQVWPGCSL